MPEEHEEEMEENDEYKKSGLDEMLDEYEYIYATLNIWGKYLDPHEVTDSLELKPTRSFKRGDRRNKNKADTAENQWKHGYWYLSSQEKIQSSDLAAHLEWLIDQLEPTKIRLIEILKRENISAGISCFWVLPSDHENLNLSYELMKKIVDLGINLELDICCIGEDEVDDKSE